MWVYWSVKWPLICIDLQYLNLLGFVDGLPSIIEFMDHVWNNPGFHAQQLPTDDARSHGEGQHFDNGKSGCLENMGTYHFLRQLWLFLGVSSWWKLTATCFPGALNTGWMKWFPGQLGMTSFLALMWETSSRKSATIFWAPRIWRSCFISSFSQKTWPKHTNNHVRTLGGLGGWWWLSGWTFKACYFRTPHLTVVNFAMPWQFWTQKGVIFEMVIYFTWPEINQK